MSTQSVFYKYIDEAWPHRYTAQIHVNHLRGGTPSDPKVAEGFIKSKLAESDDIIRQEVALLMEERGITASEAADEVAMLRSLQGFRRDPEMGLYIEGRQLKACLKEAVSVCVNAGDLPAKNWGVTNKSFKGWIAEHLMVLEDRLFVGRQEADSVEQRFVHTFRGSSILYEEEVQDAKFTATVMTDYDFDEREWALIWLKAEMEGIGASRSQGYGTFAVTGWEKIS